MSAWAVLLAAWAAVEVASLAYLAVLVWTAPQGYEDATGWHRA